MNEEREENEQRKVGEVRGRVQPGVWPYSGAQYITVGREKISEQKRKKKDKWANHKPHTNK